jgi:hypothetical protein
MLDKAKMLFEKANPDFKVFAGVEYKGSCYILADASSKKKPDLETNWYKIDLDNKTAVTFYPSTDMEFIDFLIGNSVKYD